MEDDQFVDTSKVNYGDAGRSLTPTRLRDFIGQSRIKANFEIAIEAARNRSERLDHVLLVGDTGAGKSTLATICANELDVPFRSASGDAIEKEADLAAILTNLERNSCLFIDDISDLNRKVAFVLYETMSTFAMGLVVGKGPSARSMRLPLPPFTVIGSTLRADLIPPQYRDIFGIQHQFEAYSTAELTAMVHRFAEIRGIQVTPDGVDAIANSSVANARAVDRFLSRCRDYAEVRSNGVITKEIAEAAANMLGFHSV